MAPARQLAVKMAKSSPKVSETARLKISLFGTPAAAVPGDCQFLSNAIFPLAPRESFAKVPPI
jgi:hypothetical protein